MNRIAILLAVAAASGVACRAAATVSVITTDTTLADLARQVGGSRVSVESLSRGSDDPHAVEPRPSMVVKLARAQVVARIGMDLDIWLDPLLDKCGNPQVMRGGRGYADCSRGITVREIPPAKVDPSMGDIHVYGNPHYLLDPANGIVAAGNIARALMTVDPSGQTYYRERFAAFGGRLKADLERWRAQLAPFRGQEVTTYHRTWVYFMARFGLKEYGVMEPKPGIPPSPGHVSALARRMREDGVKAMLVENFRSRRYPEMLARDTSAKAVYVPVAVEGEPGIATYSQLFDAIVGRLAAALR